MMTVQEIVQDFLKRNGYSGLCHEECGCEIDDLFACDNNPYLCAPGVKQYCKECDTEECDYRRDGGWCIVET